MSNLATGLMSRVFAKGQGDWGSIPGQVIPKTQKMVLDAALLNKCSKQQYIHMHIYAFKQILHTYTYTYTHMYIYICVCVCVHIYIFRNINLRKRVTSFDRYLDSMSRYQPVIVVKGKY